MIGEDRGELDDLAAEAEIPIAELLRRYGYVTAADDSGSDDSSDKAYPPMSSKADQLASPSKLKTVRPDACVEVKDSASLPGESGTPAKHTVVVKSEVPSPAQDVSQDVDITDENLRQAATQASLIQPTGTTLSTARVRIPQPFLLKHELREYQLIGMNWLVTMYEKNLNGILADEMGLGKTIQTISLLAYLACEKHTWGPHLIVVPTSVMLNWEMELKKWCPAFKILTYYGSVQERKQKRVGWTKENTFHVCITSYKLVTQDYHIFRRKRWDYLILDEAQNIKNFRSQRWQLLLNFNSNHRLLLTGTPLQNNLMELWSLMHFLMPTVFQSHKDFQDWFSNPVSSMIEGKEQMNQRLIQRLHAILRPFLLRRLKSEVEQQMPKKFEHVIHCKLSKRQRFLYDEFMSRAQTRETLASGNFLSIINCLMQLRKVCNHPDLFESRAINSPHAFPQLRLDWVPSFQGLQRRCSPDQLSPKVAPFLLFAPPSVSLLAEQDAFSLQQCPRFPRNTEPLNGYRAEVRTILAEIRQIEANRLEALETRGSQLNRFRCNRPLFMSDELIRRLRFYRDDPLSTATDDSWDRPKMDAFRLSRTKNSLYLLDLIRNFVFAVPKVFSKTMSLTGVAVAGPTLPVLWDSEATEGHDLLQEAQVRQRVYFPDRRLIQYDCGKLQAMDQLLRDLAVGDHRTLIFTQMTRVLDILEIFLNLHGYRYVRLDGSTKIEHRQLLVERFNSDRRIFAFISSTRSGGLGLNLTGADTVIFYDSDWNPAMDAQAQDRCHRIGQLRNVHIYRLISEHTVEENILQKANQKRFLDDVVIRSGGFTTDYFKKLSVRDLFAGEGIAASAMQDAGNRTLDPSLVPKDISKALAMVEDETDVAALKQAEREMDAELAEFNETVPVDPEKEEPVVRDSTDGTSKGVSTADVIQSEAASAIDQAASQQIALGEDLEATLTPIQRYAFYFLLSDSAPSRLIEELGLVPSYRYLS